MGDKIFHKTLNKWENRLQNLPDVILMDVYGKKIPIETIDSLIDYKSKQLRDFDITDLEQLRLIKFRKG